MDFEPEFQGLKPVMERAFPGIARGELLTNCYLEHDGEWSDLVAW